MKVDSHHPIWSVIALVVLMVTMTVTLWLNASHFDSTELKSLVVLLFALATREVLPHFVGRHRHDR